MKLNLISLLLCFTRSSVFGLVAQQQPLQELQNPLLTFASPDESTSDLLSNPSIAPPNGDAPSLAIASSEEIELTTSSSSEVPTLLTLIFGNPSLTIVSGILKDHIILQDLVASAKEVTAFLPHDDYFKHKPEIPDDDELIGTFLYNMVKGSYLVNDMKDGQLLDSLLILETLDDKNQKIKVIRIDGEDEGDDLRLNGHVSLVSPDLSGSNGILHITSAFLTPPPNALYMLLHDFKKYAAFLVALKRTGLDALVGKQFGSTVLAPTNDAFKKIPLAKLIKLFNPASTSQLVLLLLGHISPTLIYSSDILNAEHNKPTSPPLVLPTLGLPVTARPDSLGTTIVLNGGEAVVDYLDLLASNAVIHGIDNLLGLDFVDFEGGEGKGFGDGYREGGDHHPHHHKLHKGLGHHDRKKHHSSHSHHQKSKKHHYEEEDLSHLDWYSAIFM